MKISFSEAGTGWFELRAAMTDFDGQPHVPALRYQWSRTPSSTDRIAVAAALCFAPWCAGRMELPAPISALTASRIQAWFSHFGVWVAPEPVRTGGLPIPGGERFAVLDCCQSRARNTLVVEYVDPSEGSGIAPDRVRVATNARYFDRHDGDYGALFAKVAVAVLIAEDIDAGVLTYNRKSWLGRATAQAAQELLESVGLGVTDGF